MNDIDLRLKELHEELQLPIVSMEDRAFLDFLYRETLKEHSRSVPNTQGEFFAMIYNVVAQVSELARQSNKKFDVKFLTTNLCELQLKWLWCKDGRIVMGTDALPVSDENISRVFLSLG